jgi:hypothetical protein
MVLLRQPQMPASPLSRMHQLLLHCQLMSQLG